MSEWQPIETAPKDEGVRVLLWWPYWGSGAVIGWWDFHAWESDDAISTGGPGPTHWLPLPEPPVL